MNLIKIGIGVTDPTVGAFTSNTDRLIARAKQMQKRKATKGVFGEMCIAGYPAEDLVNWKEFVTLQLSELRRFARETKDGFPTVFEIGLAVIFDTQVYNSVATVCRGIIHGIVPKEDNPTYNVFYELRKYARGYAGLIGEVEGIPFGDLMYQAAFGKFSTGVCETLWQAGGPMVRHAYYGSVLDAYVNASPWRIGVRATVCEMVATRSSDNLIIVPYANIVGGQDSLTFYGGGYNFLLGRSLLNLGKDDWWREGNFYSIADVDEVTAARTNNTTWRLRCEEFVRSNKPRCKLIDVDSAQPNEPEYYSELKHPKSFFMPTAKVADPVVDLMDDLENAMITGLAGYLEKTLKPSGQRVFKRIGISNSGGRDSILILILAFLYARKKGLDPKDFIHCFSFPTKYNSEETKGLSRVSSEVLGVSFDEIPISQAVEVLNKTLVAMHGGDETAITRIAKQNLQSRVRAILIMTWANSIDALVLQTGVMSEEATGYSTILGDHNAGFLALIKNLPKTLGNALLAHFRAKYNLAFIDDLLRSTASAELEDNQSDERDLMPYDILDDCIHLFAGRWLMPHELYRVLRQKWSDEELLKLAPHYKNGMLKEWVYKFVTRFFGSVFKWVQAPLGIHLGNLDLDRERALQLPVVQSLEWLQSSFDLMRAAE